MFCRAGSSEIIVPCHKFTKSAGRYFSAGMRFKMRVETEDASERRLVSRISEFHFPALSGKLILFG